MSTPSPQDLEADPIPTELRLVVELFASELAKVAFPDVDATVLHKEVEVLRVRATEVRRAREALALAESALAQRTTVLAELAARGLAYARIYADAHPDRASLARKLEATVTPPAPPTADAAPRRRGRPPKAPRAELPFERSAEGASAAAPA